LERPRKRPFACSGLTTERASPTAATRPPGGTTTWTSATRTAPLRWRSASEARTAPRSSIFPAWGSAPRPRPAHAGFVVLSATIHRVEPLPRRSSRRLVPRGRGVRRI